MAYDQNAADALRELEMAVGTRDSLVRALRRYGHHDKDCEHGNVFDPNSSCSCGFNEALQAALTGESEIPVRSVRAGRQRRQAMATCIVRGCDEPGTDRLLWDNQERNSTGHAVLCDEHYPQEHLPACDKCGKPQATHHTFDHIQGRYLAICWPCHAILARTAHDTPETTV